jgi:hypothetical protein
MGCGTAQSIVSAASAWHALFACSAKRGRDVGLCAAPIVSISPNWTIRKDLTTMLAKLRSGQSIDQVIAWANDELEGFSR